MPEPAEGHPPDPPPKRAVCPHQGCHLWTTAAVASNGGTILPALGGFRVAGSLF